MDTKYILGIEYYYRLLPEIPRRISVRALTCQLVTIINSPNNYSPPELNCDSVGCMEVVMISSWPRVLLGVKKISAYQLISLGRLELG